MAEAAPRARNACDDVEAMNEAIGYRAEFRVVIRSELFTSRARHAEYINCFWRGTLIVRMSCRKRGERGAQTVTGDEERLASLLARSASLANTFGLSVARRIRKNAILQTLFSLFFQRAVPIAFAFGLIVLGAVVANRALFDAFSAAGYFCRIQKDTLRGKDFETADMCWDSGNRLTKGTRYRITLDTRGDWFDRTRRTDVRDFPPIVPCITWARCSSAGGPEVVPAGRPDRRHR